MKSIGIDIGTTTIAIVVLDEKGKILYRETVENDSFLLPSNEVERIQDVSIIITQLVRKAHSFRGGMDSTFIL